MAERSLHAAWPGWLAGALVAVAGAGWIAQRDLDRQHDAFDTDARIAHRLLSQQVVQHDAVLATLALLQPGSSGAPEAAPEQRLPALYPQVLRVERRERGAAWPDPSWQAAEALARERQRAVIADMDFAHGRYTLLRAAEPTSFALQIDIARMAPWSEWPMQRDGPVRVALQQSGQTVVLQPGRGAGGPWRFDFAKHLATDSQPFEMTASRSVGFGDLPWFVMLAWTAAVAGVTAALAAWRRQRAARRRAEELLRLGQVGRLNALGELAAGMAHELNQPLAALLANTQAARRLLDDEPPELDTARHAMQQATLQAKRASEVVERLRRAVQRPDSQAGARTVALAEPVRNVLYLLEPECTRRSVVPRWNGAAGSADVHADPVALEQIVHNLVMNGLQALEQVPPAERELAIEVEHGSDGTAALCVSDSGPGIAAEALPHVFEPFFSTRSDGLGLGLSLCETLAAGMGGTLSARNRSPRGAEFRLTLPLATA